MSVLAGVPTLGILPRPRQPFLTVSSRHVLFAPTFIAGARDRLAALACSRLCDIVKAFVRRCRCCSSMAVPRTIQALRLLVVALAVSAAIPAASAQWVSNLGATAMAATAAQSTLPLASMAITQPATTFASSCGLTTTVQSTDTPASITCAHDTPTHLHCCNVKRPVMVTHGVTCGVEQIWSCRSHDLRADLWLRRAERRSRRSM